MKTCDKFHAHAEAMGVTQDHVDAINAAGLGWLTVVALLMQYGPMVFQIIKDVLAALKQPGGITPDVLGALIGKYGQSVFEIVNAIMTALGKAPVPPIELPA